MLIPVHELQGEARSMSEEEFIKRYPDPAFVLQPDAPGPGLIDLGTARIQHDLPEEWLSKTVPDGRLPPLDDPFSPALTPAFPDPTSIAPRVTHVVFIKKAVVNPSPFPDMITLGRVTTNDIPLPFSAVSKVHAVVIQGDPHYLQDQNSTNGTWLGSTRLGPGEKGILEDGAWVNLGAALGMKFFLPPALYGFLCDPGGSLGPRPDW